MSRSLLISAVALVVLGLLLAFLAPTGNMGAQEAFYARLLILIPALFCALILFGFSAVVGAINRLENQGEQLRLLLATRGEPLAARPIPNANTLRRMDEPGDEEEDVAVAAPKPGLFGRALKRVKPGEQDKKAPPQASIPSPALPSLDDEQIAAPPPPRTPSAPPSFVRPPVVPEMPAPISPAATERRPDFDISFLDRALREPQSDEAPSDPPAPQSEDAADGADPVLPPLGQPRAVPSTPPLAALPLTRQDPALHPEPPSRLEPLSPLRPVPAAAPLSPQASPQPPLQAAPPPVAAPAQAAKREAALGRAPTIAELLAQDLAAAEAAPPEKPKPRVVREGQFAGRSYRTFEDGSLEIDTEQSTLRFDSLEEFRAFVSNSGQ